VINTLQLSPHHVAAGGLIWQRNVDPLQTQATVNTLEMKAARRTVAATASHASGTLRH